MGPRGQSSVRNSLRPTMTGNDRTVPVGTSTRSSPWDLKLPLFNIKYSRGSLLGTGSYGQVWTCFERATGDMLACKVFDKARVHATTTQEQAVRKEIRVMQELKGEHLGVLQMREALESRQEVYVVMELCRGGDLFELLSNHGRLPEHSAKLLLTQIGSALELCHSKGIIHRDIKPENILLDRPAKCLYHSTASLPPPGIQAKLADFGLAAVIKPGETTTGYNGSRYYVAPEMLLGQAYDSSVDIWSLGVLLCTMLTGSLPFRGSEPNDREGLKMAILKGKVNFKSVVWAGVSAEAVALVSRMLCMDPQKRIKAWEILCDPWCTEEGATNKPSMHFQVADSPRSQTSPLKVRPWDTLKAHANGSTGGQLFGSEIGQGPVQSQTQVAGEMAHESLQLTGCMPTMKTPPRMDAGAEIVLHSQNALPSMTSLTKRDGMCTCTGFLHLKQECKKNHRGTSMAIPA